MTRIATTPAPHGCEREAEVIAAWMRERGEPFDRAALREFLAARYPRCQREIAAAVEGLVRQ